MKNYKTTIQYEGTKYNGWQKQGNTKNTIQEKFENILFRMTGKHIEINASGRTDRGVHSEGQCANFKCDTNMSDVEILKYLNDYLPEDIAVLDIEGVEERFHARLSAKKKTYEYRISYNKKPDVFKRRTCCFIDKNLDVEMMKKAAQKFIGTHDFKGFSSLKKIKKSTVRTIYHIDIKEEDNILKIEINGDGFLYNMVRIIVGTLAEIGMGEREIDSIEDILEKKIRETAGATMPACGLVLKRVYYWKMRDILWESLIIF